MQYEQDSVPHPSEIHRYFPEWADRPASADRLLEADHNSYLAGGYSEEFGYRLRADRQPAFALLTGDPDRSGQWAVQIGCLHPGYPECPRPADRIGVSPLAIGNGTADRGRGNADKERAVHSSDEATMPDGVTVSDGTALHVGITRVLEVSRTSAERHMLVPKPIITLWTRLRVRRRARAQVM